MNSGDDKPMDFWSRRKAAVREAEAAEIERRDAELETAKRVELEEKTDAEILEELGLPDPDSLQKDDDFTQFLAKTVPERLRRRALRRLWLSNPVLANLDGLNDYDDDFTDASTAGQVVKTAYEVGRGFLKKSLKRGRTKTRTLRWPEKVKYFPGKVILLRRNRNNLLQRSILMSKMEKHLFD